MANIKKFPLPTGKYKVGFYDDYLTYEHNNEKRMIGYRCFYPAINVTGDPVNYINEEIFEKIKESLGNAPFVNIYKEYVNISTNCYQNVTMAEGCFKAVIYTPGYNNVQWDNLSVIEELVSNGYVVFDIARAKDALFTKIGETLIARDTSVSGPMSNELVKYMIEDEEYSPTNPNFVYEWSLKGMQSYVRKCIIATQKSELWIKDLVKLMDEIENKSKDNCSIIYNKIDCSGFGAFGNSLGGATSLAAALEDKRIKASMNMDGWVFGGKLLDNKLESPALVFNKSQKHFEANYGIHNNNIINIIFKRTQNEYMSDMCLTNEDEIKNIYVGKEIIDGYLMAQIKADFIRTLFNIYLKKDTSQSLKDIANKYQDEVSIH